MYVFIYIHLCRVSNKSFKTMLHGLVIITRCPLLKKKKVYILSVWWGVKWIIHTIILFFFTSALVRFRITHTSSNACDHAVSNTVKEIVRVMSFLNSCTANVLLFDRNTKCTLSNIKAYWRWEIQNVYKEYRVRRMQLLMQIQQNRKIQVKRRVFLAMWSQ